MISYNRNAINIFVFPTLLLVWLFPQIHNEPFVDLKVGKEYFIKRVLESPEIDGNIDDSTWHQIISITDFLQQNPDNMVEPTEKTEVYITYDDKSLYVAARLYDSTPNDISQQLAPRDDWYGAFDDMADWFSIDLDSRHDHQTGFSFAVNASGVLSDEMIYRDGDFDSDWNAIWQAEIQIDELGWTLEMEIPFSNLPFYDGNNLTWGMNITRFIQRKYETITWVAFPNDVEGVVSTFGHITGFNEIYPPAKFEFKPYSMSGITNYTDILLTDYELPKSHRLNYADHSKYNLGMDLIYRFDTNAKLTFTINPDFGQIESDPADVNLTAFETYFLEKRPFFLKDIDIFETPIEIFYSRRIGEAAWGQGMKIYEDALSENNDTIYYNIPVIIKGAGKFTGKTENGLSYGLLGAVTTIKDSSSWTNQIMKSENKNYFVSRIKQDLFSGNSFIGLMTTSSPTDSAHTFSVDGKANFFDNQIGIEGQLIKTLDKYKGMYGSLSFSPLGYFSGWVDYIHYDIGLDLNDIGYLWRDDYSKIKVGLKFQTLDRWKMVRNASIILEGDAEKNMEGLDIGRSFDLSYDMQFNNLWKIGGGFFKIIEHYDDRKIILNYDQQEFGPPILIPDIIGSHFNISTYKHHNIWASLAWTWAMNTRDDLERGQYVELTYNPNPYLRFSISYDRYRLTKQYQWLETFLEWDDYHHIFSDLHREVDALTFRVMGNVNRKLSILGYLEIYSNQDDFDKTTYSEYSPYTNDYSQTDYIDGGWIDGGGQVMGSVYTQNISQLESSYLDPNLYLGLYPKYTSMVFNWIIKWNYIKGSDIHFVYSFNKSVNGTPFRELEDLKDFLLFNDKQDWVEVLRDQTFMIKIDYWFEK